MIVRITISSTPDGLYAWELRDGPEGTFHETGLTNTIARALTDIARARASIAAHLADDPHSRTPYQPHLPLHLDPSSHLHPPNGDPRSLQKNVPPLLHEPTSSNSVYLQPSKSG